MDISQVAQNLYKKHLGRYLIYDMEGHRVRFRYRGHAGTYKIAKVKRDVFGNKIYLTSTYGKTFEFREPSYILKENEKTVFIYLDTTLKEEDGGEAEIGSKIEFTIMEESVTPVNKIESESTN